MTRRHVPAVGAAALALLLAGTAVAQEMRVLRPIGRNPPGVGAAAPLQLPEGAVRAVPQAPVPFQQVEAAMASVTRAWNERRLDPLLRPGYSRGQELQDALQTKVPRNAALRVVSIQGWQVLDQYRLGALLFSRLAVQVQTRLEFEDAAGFQARDGINTYVLTVGHAEGG